MGLSLKDMPCFRKKVNTYYDDRVEGVIGSKQVLQRPAEEPLAVAVFEGGRNCNLLKIDQLIFL